ncbi:hypothetical protein [Yinghuangia soli]|uniref:PknH-like extracellular domain-containing protein n=1 Tax=Yinghuangia soli TaxID=2908204 RepID=A0AA41U4B1_9ACTN|nr:hypothetical protein [Yinghuangia soli]MCF2530627.1 hypothetical protein [Yinghuangia soli]
MRHASRRLITVAAVPLLFLATACGSDDKKEDAKSAGATGAQTPGAESTGGGSAGGSSGGSASTPAGGANAGSGGGSNGGGKTLTTAQLTSALVAAGDLPSGWTVEPDEEDEPTGASKASTPACQPLADLLNASGPVKGVGRASAELQTTSAPTTTYNVGLLSFPSGEAAKVLAAAKKAVPSCAEFTADSDGTMVTYKVALAAGAKAGDESLGLSVNMSAEGMTFDAPIVFVRSGSVLVGAQGLDMNGSSAKPIDNAVIKAQVEKIAAAQKS